MRKSNWLALVIFALLGLVLALYCFAGYLGLVPWLKASRASQSAQESARLAAATLPPGTPPAPKGYRNNAAVMAAIGLKKLKLVSTTIATPAEVVETRGIEYGRVGSRVLQLDLYQPAWRSGKRLPGLIFIHGGAWSGGSREVYKLYTVRFARRGYVTATVSYRLSGEAPFPAAVEDVKCAVRWLRANADKYGVDEGKLGIIGGSAGGHLAMMVGYGADQHAYDASGGLTNVSSRVAAVVDFYGPFDLTTDFAKKHPAVRQFLGGKTFAEAPQLYVAASPAHYLRAGAPPTLVFHGTIDDTVPIDQADQLARRLAELKVPFIYDRLEGWPHALDVAEEVNVHCDFVLTSFLDRYLPSPR